MHVRGEPTIFYVSEKGEASLPFLRALETQGITVSVNVIVDIPDTLSDLIEHDVMILDNVSGFDISLTKMALIERYVRDAGGGLIMIGGENSYGAGGYYKTPIEAALPVDTDVSSSLNIPGLTIVMIIDKSGSMNGRVEDGESKLDVVKAAAYSAIELLNPYHKVGLLAFDADYEWTVPIVDAGQRRRIADDLFRLSPGGGTRLFPALEEGYRMLSETVSSVKHIIVLSDGLTDEQDFEELTKGILEQKITVSTVAVGEDSDRKLMSDIARQGGGRSYYTADPHKIPRIFTTETITVSRGLIVEELFFPLVRSSHDIIKGIEPRSIPPLMGFVLTYLKPGAEEVLSVHDESPLLAVWRYGLGRSVAFASDLKGKWGIEWTLWDKFPKFASQLIRWVERPRYPQQLDVRLSVSGGIGTIDADALDETGKFINYLALNGMVIDPNGDTQEVILEQVAPGKYTGSFAVGDTGEYLLTVFGSNEDRVISPETFGISVSYNQEYLDLKMNDELLEKSALLTGGRLLSLENNEGRGKIFMAEEDDYESFQGLWFYLVLSALVLFILDVAVRKGGKKSLMNWRDRGDHAEVTSRLYIAKLKGRGRQKRG